MQGQPWEIAALIGLPDPNKVTFLDLAAACGNGLPVKCLHELARALATNEQAFLDALFSRSTLRRRQRRGTLTAEESDLVVRLAATWHMACDTFADSEKARRFLFREHALLRGRKPVDLAAMNLAGVQAIEQVLGRLRYGTAA